MKTAIIALFILFTSTIAFAGQNDIHGYLKDHKESRAIPAENDRMTDATTTDLSWYLRDRTKSRGFK